jgi:hypothetical protein
MYVLLGSSHRPINTTARKNLLSQFRIPMEEYKMAVYNNVLQAAERKACAEGVLPDA